VSDAGWVFALTLVDELVRGGVADACLAPGSRSAPLALALAEHPGTRVHVHLDERSAGFFALGAAKRSGRPVAVVCTSGTAAANLHPAVLEAHHARVPLLVLTADRPPELRDTGANQTVDQLRLYGGAVRWFCEVGLPVEGTGAGRYWRSLAARAVAAAAGPPAGPVHLNLAFAEPLVPRRLGGEPAPGRAGRAPWTVSATLPRAGCSPAEVEALAEQVRAARRGLLVVGWGAGLGLEAADGFARAAGWPVLADPLSGHRRGPHAVAAYDALLRVPVFAATHRPDLVVRVGAGPTSKALASWLDPSVPQVLVDPDGAWPDPGRAAATRLVADPSALLGAVAAALARARPSGGAEPGGAESGAGPAGRDAAGAARGRSGRPAATLARGHPPDGGAWVEAWTAADALARSVMDALLDGWEEPFEGRVARDLVAGLPAGATLVVGSSMPVRDVDTFARARDGLAFVANRGASGIDGFVATALGVAAAAAGPVAALCGDLTFLHDASSVLGAGRRPEPVAFVVCDNDGGGIFSFLPQADLPEPYFEPLFGTPHGLDLGALAAAAGLPSRRIERAGDLVPAVADALAAGRTTVLLVPGDRAVNLARHRAVAQAVADALATRPPAPT
jgi:2-succinyl-5-enolpyruvyl-6-hydroxy-3-cyclohexene-1-carboxylate synthase